MITFKNGPAWHTTVALIIGKNDCTNKLGNSSALPHIVCLVANIACTIKRCLYNNIDIIQDHSSIHAIYIAACIFSALVWPCALM